MAEQERSVLERKSLVIHPAKTVKPPLREHEPQTRKQTLPGILRRLGNRNIQRILQRSGGEPRQVDDEVSSRINQERGGGAPLEDRLQMQMSSQLGYDLSGVRVHNTPSSDQLNRQLDARAFTTGQDIFFRSGEYNPGSSGGQELLAHELTHVVQQGTGQVQGTGSMTVNAPGDRYEQQADRTAGSLMSNLNSSTPVSANVAQRQSPEEEEEEKSLQTSSLLEDEEQVAQTQEEDEEEKTQLKPYQH